MRYAMVLVMAACTAPDQSAETLRKSGFTEIEIGGYDPFSCSDSDDFSTHFRAKNPTGETVEGTVCCGWLKACTVRF